MGEWVAGAESNTYECLLAMAAVTQPLLCVRHCETLAALEQSVSEVAHIRKGLQSRRKDMQVLFFAIATDKAEKVGRGEDEIEVLSWFLQPVGPGKRETRD